MRGRGRRRRMRRRSVMEGGSTHETMKACLHGERIAHMAATECVVISGCRERGQLRCDLCTHIQSH